MCHAAWCQTFLLQFASLPGVKYFCCSFPVPLVSNHILRDPPTVYVLTVEPLLPSALTHSGLGSEDLLFVVSDWVCCCSSRSSTRTMPSATTTNPIHLARARLLSIMNLKMKATGSSETLYPPARLLIIASSKSVLWMFHTNIFICCHSVAAIHAVLFIPAKAWVLLYVISLTLYLRIMVWRISVSWYVMHCWVIGAQRFVRMWHPWRWRWHIFSKCWEPLSPAVPCHIPGYRNLWLCHGENLNTHKYNWFCMQCSYACSYPLLWLVWICILKLNFHVFGSPVVLWTSPLTLSKWPPHSYSSLKELCEARCHTCMIRVLTVLANCCSVNILFCVLLCQFIWFLHMWTDCYSRTV